MLEKYLKKRKFGKTTEPQGLIKGSPSGILGANFPFKGKFVVQEHHARNLHYDFRLELPENWDKGNIVLKSWAVPKGVPEKIGVKRLAVEVEDHPVEYIDFEGVIPAGEYGAGKVKIWDKGKFAGLKIVGANGHSPKELQFELAGRKLKGKYVMVRTKYGKGKGSWLLFRVK